MRQIPEHCVTFRGFSRRQLGGAKKATKLPMYRGASSLVTSLYSVVIGSTSHDSLSELGSVQCTTAQGVSGEVIGRYLSMPAALYLSLLRPSSITIKSFVGIDPERSSLVDSSRNRGCLAGS